MVSSHRIQHWWTQSLNLTLQENRRRRYSACLSSEELVCPSHHHLTPRQKYLSSSYQSKQEEKISDLVSKNILFLGYLALVVLTERVKLQSCSSLQIIPSTLMIRCSYYSQPAKHASSVAHCYTILLSVNNLILLLP